MRRRLRLALSAGAAVAVLGPLGWVWQDSLLPGTYPVMDMGYVDPGGALRRATRTGTAGWTCAPHGRPRPSGGRLGHPDRAAGAGPPGLRPHGRRLHPQRHLPGPTIRATVGDLVEVRLVNISVADGATIHWHGVDVPGAEDGVAGVTQDAVAPGAEDVHRFVADRPGTYWYHSHQHSAEQVAGGLLGALVVDPATRADPADDVLTLVHHDGGVATVNGQEGDVVVPAAPGSRVRVRVIDTDNGPMWVWVGGGPFAVAPVDGTDVHEPSPVDDRALLVPAGGRADVVVTLPDDGSPLRVHLGGRTGTVLSSSTCSPTARRPRSASTRRRRTAGWTTPSTAVRASSTGAPGSGGP